MTDTLDALRELYGIVPSDLAAYFERARDGTMSGREDLELNLLQSSEAVRWTNDFRDFHPIVSTLRGVILDNADTSNHHVYLSLPVCAGSVLYLAHDGDSRIVFPGLNEFVTACQKAMASGNCLRSYHPAVAVLLPNQPELGQLTRDLLDGRHDCDGSVVALSLIPSIDLSDFPLLRRLASDDDFYIAEAIGDAIAQRPRSDLEPVAELCANHPHVQASAAGKRALTAIAAAK